MNKIFKVLFIQGVEKMVMAMETIRPISRNRETILQSLQEKDLTNPNSILQMTLNMKNVENVEKPLDL